jgi:glycosyltransferase involved in cell wall biosynthesis
VILATRDRAASLQRLLPRLLSLSPGLSREVIVADNGSRDGTPALLASLAPAVRAVHEPLPGKCRALNRAVAVARGELLVFTDDDVEPDDAWLDALAAAAARHPDVECFGGRIVVDPHAVPAWVLRSRLRQLLTSAHDFGEEEGPYPANRFPIGPNMALRRRALRGITDPFPVDLGPGTRVPVGDETAFFYRLGLGGGQPRMYVPSAKVRHDPPASYFDLPAALRRALLGGYGAGLVNGRYPEQARNELVGVPLLGKVAGTRSWRELLCSGVRLAGYLGGYARGRAS